MKADSINYSPLSLQRIKIADSELDLIFPSGNIISVKAGDKMICIGKHNNNYFAFQRNCPHAGADLSKGYIDPVGNVVCPLHHYKFSVENGRNVSGEGYFLKRYPLEIREDGVWVEL